MITGDWKKRIGRHRLKKLLLRDITNGSVILLHDCGDSFGSNHDAPKNMINALAEVIPEIKRRGYRFVRVDEMIASKRKNLR